MTNGKLVSIIGGRLNAINKDAFISRRTILDSAKVHAATLISQKLADGSLRKEAMVFKTLKCFKLKAIKSVECDIVAFKTCTNLMKSVKKLPEIFSSKNGLAIATVSNIDSTILYDDTTLRQYVNSSKRQFSDLVTNTYYIQDGYLYLPNSTNELVTIVMMPKDEYDMLQKSDCNPKSCMSFWDYEFICPDKLIEAVMGLTMQDLLPKVQIPEDELPNLDSNIKTQTTQ